ncbi:GPW/gp25 family protein [Acinetobacter sp. WC-323]|uniref:GPW/gp25 family protein n=1 Tax=Acinetobacter sp. WC-323 TaxID=903918 RepID=UPI0002E285EE|nr:GPW/gp25 family protein [Acinetobacter sp. WC-323]
MMSRENGRALMNELEHIRQSIQDLLTTPIGTRIMRREYGSLVPMLIDAPFDDITILQLYAATATAILRWEDRIILNSISLKTKEAGSYYLDMDCSLVDSNQKASLSIPLAIGSV